jgi:hypothetical protein
MPRPNPFAVDLAPASFRQFSLFELLLFPLVVAAAYLLFHQLHFFALVFYAGLIVIDLVICFFDASQKQPVEASYRASPWRRRLLAAILGASFGVIPLFLLYLVVCAFMPELSQFPAARLFEGFTAAGAGLGYLLPSLATPLLWLMAAVLALLG